MTVVQNALQNAAIGQANMFVLAAGTHLYTKPANLRSVNFLCVGAGGGGASLELTVDETIGCGGNGGAGTAGSLTLSAAAVPATFDIIVGAGGAAGAPPSAGGDTILDLPSQRIVPGGAAGEPAAIGAGVQVADVSGAVAAPTGAWDWTAQGQRGGSVFGDWKGIDATVGVFILGGNASSLYPGDFPFVAYVSSGNNGNFDGQVPTNPGVGGMGGVAWRTDALAEAAGSAGADGLVIVTEYLAL